MYYKINEEAAKRANDANRFCEYQQGSATANYHRMVDKAVEIAENQKKRVDSMYHDKIDWLLDTYCRKLADNLNARNAIDARVPSVMISGGSNFPVGKKAKQNAARDRNYEEYRNIEGLLDKIRSTGMGGISSDDPQALKKLERKLSDLQMEQQIMKDVNAYYRKHKTLDGCPFVSEQTIHKLKAEMSREWHLEDKPFASYLLSNNNANIRRVKQRVEELRKRQEEPAPEGWEFEGGKVVVNSELNRLQIVFDDKPNEELREDLKAEGFRWAPSQGAWQRQRTDNAFRAARRINQLKAL